jgi:inosose dehydratase
MHRRRFLQALGVGGLAIGGCGGGRGRFGGFTMAIQSWTFRVQPLADALTSIASLGITRVELSPQAAHFGFPATDDQIAELRAALAANGLDCVTSGLEPATGDHEQNRAVFEYARKLGLRTIMVDPPPESLDSLDALVREYDVRVGIHNHGPGTRYSRIEDVDAALAGRDRRMGCIIDTGHYTRAGVDPIEAFRHFAGRVYGVHLKDVAAANPAAPDTILGEGVVDLPAVFDVLREIDFPADASLSLEYEGNPEMPYDDVIVCLDNAARAASGG